MPGMNLVCLTMASRSHFSSQSQNDDHGWLQYLRVAHLDVLGCIDRCILLTNIKLLRSSYLVYFGDLVFVS